MVKALTPPSSPRAVAIYIRWSTDEQTEGTTLEVQTDRCILYIRSQGWEVGDGLIFVDDGYSGGSLDRPALTRLRAAIRNGLVDCVVSYSIDRLSRNLADITELIQKEWLGRCSFRSATQPIGTDEGNPTGQLVFNILASFAEFERGLIRERTHSGSIRRAKEGKYPGGKMAPYGYVRDGKGSLAVVEDKAAVVRRMFEMAITGPYGQGPAVIARALNGQGTPSPTGGKWWAYGIREILRNPIYAGTVTYGRRKNNAGHLRDQTIPRRTKRDTPLVQVEDAAPALVSRETWERVQELEEGRRKTYAKKGGQASNRALLTGLLLCRCGGPLHVFQKQDKKRYYRCSRNAQAGGCSHQPGIYDAEELERLVVDHVMARYGTPELRATMLQTVEQKLNTAAVRKEYMQSRALIEQRLKEIDADIVRVRRSARTGEIKLTTYEELKADADLEKRDLEVNRRGVEIALENIPDTSSLLQTWRQTLSQVDLWQDLATERQREVLIGLLRQVMVFRRRGSDAPVAVDFLWEQPHPGKQGA